MFTSVQGIRAPPFVGAYMLQKCNLCLLTKVSSFAMT